MSSPARYYGFMQPQYCYHSSLECPVVKRSSRRSQAEARVYDSQKAAAVAGHGRPCKYCMGHESFDSQSKQRFNFSRVQYEALKVIVGIFNKTKSPMSLRDIAAGRKRTTVSTYLIVRTLRDLGVVDQKIKMGGKRASGRTITPTQKGIDAVKIGGDGIRIEGVVPLR